MNNPFEYVPDAACDEAFRRLLVRLESLKESDNPNDVNFCRELEAGKMLGVMITVDERGISHTLYAFSGQIGSGGFHYDGFVGPVFDYLNPDGYFKTKEDDISCQNREIAAFEKGELVRVTSEFEREQCRLNTEVETYKEKCRLSKLARKKRRESGNVDEVESAAMIRQSQFEKAELHRLKKNVTARLVPYTAKLNDAQSRLEAMKERRRADSEALQKWLFSNFKLLNARGESKNLSEIFAQTNMKIPPSGAGECCAPKLLQAAYRQGLHPVSMAEYWYGRPKDGEVRRHGEHYPACRGKCLPVLGWMLQGLSVEPSLESDCRVAVDIAPEVVFENQWFCVVNKPSGMLSVPGKNGAYSVQQWLIERYGEERSVKMAHRLDQDTSGLLIATFGESAYKIMQNLFATRKVKKTYIAELEGDYDSLNIARRGRIALPLSADWLDRPRQRVDTESGKEALTDYEFISAAEGRSRIVFHPLTGRTHQLRIHSASESGLGMPIVGDRLYGRHSAERNERLKLHAQKIEFTFPLDNRRYSFEIPAPF